MCDEGLVKEIKVTRRHAPYICKGCGRRERVLFANGKCFGCNLPSIKDDENE